jgi:hypothetical protein
MGWVRALILLCASTGIVAAQGLPTLQLGTPIERTIAPGQSHSYQIIAEENTLVQITVEQRGVDVVVRIHNPVGKKVGEYDSPNGDDGPENVSFVTTAKAPYRIEVTPLSREPAPAGRYEIRLIELRPATEEEIKQSKNAETLKARGIALLGDLEGLVTEIRLPQTRIRTQMQIAHLLWDTDDKGGLKFLTDAITGYKELLSNLDPNSKEYTKTYHPLANLRYELLQILINRQPELALSFIRSTPPLLDPYGNQRDVTAQDAAFELEIANRIAQKDPKRTLEIARENLKSGYSPSLGGTLVTLRQQNAEMAAELANEIANKLLGEKLLRNSPAAGLVVSLIQLSAPSGGDQNGGTNGSSRPVSLLSQQQRRDLLQKALSEALAYKPPPSNAYSPERDYAWTLLHGLQSLGAELESVMNGGASAVEKKIKELAFANNPQMEALQQFQNALNDMNMPLDDVLKTLAHAPKDQRDQLYIHLANRVANSGDLARAKQILNDLVISPYQRQQALYNLEQQEMYRSMSKGKIEEALRSIAALPTVEERAQMIGQIANQIGPGYKRAAALNFIEQARGLLPSSLQAQNHSHLNALLEIAKAFGRYDSKRAFEIVDPLVDQFNELSAAARTLEGFAGEFYEQEELNVQNGNAVANVASQISSTIGMLALGNFDRAKVTAERIRLPEVRLRAYLEMAQQTIQNSR